jgi:effector-binding domain-containing protein
MKTKTIDSIDVIYATEMLTLQDINSKGNIVSPLILKDVEKYDLEANGPWIFISYGRDGKKTTTFQHDYCLQVKNTKNYKGSFKIKKLPVFYCAYVEYKGDVSEKMLGGNGYDPLVKSIRKSGKQFTGESREVYTKWISPTSKDNEFEIQFGIK